MPQRYASIACNLDAAILSAAYPLLAEGKVDALEWSFDTLYKVSDIPPWFEELLDAFSRENRLVGHGVFFSLFSGRWTSAQQNWLDDLRLTARRYRFDHITEHFGFMTGKDFHQGAPLSIPMTNTTLAIGQDRLKRIQDAGSCAVGLENLAFSYSMEEVKKHGDFLRRLVEPVNGFIILDLHNLYCQMHNFSLSFTDIIVAYPLDRVREIHISGGSWDAITEPVKKNVRRDTHDDNVPDDVFDMLALTMDYCPNLKYIVLEQIGSGLETVADQLQFQNDFDRMYQIVAEKNSKVVMGPVYSFRPDVPLTIGAAPEDEDLFRQQNELARILEQASSYTEAIKALERSTLANSDWDFEHWQPYMLETARKIARKWKDGFA